MMLAELFRRKVFTPPRPQRPRFPARSGCPPTADAVLAEPSSRSEWRGFDDGSIP